MGLAWSQSSIYADDNAAWTGESLHDFTQTSERLVGSLPVMDVCVVFGARRTSNYSIIYT